MHVKPAIQRIENWVRKYDPERVKEMTEEGKDKFRQHAEEKFAALAALEIMVKQVLAAYPTPVSLVPMYLCFAREVWKAHQKYSGPMLAHEGAIKADKWVARRLDREILADICRNIFDFPLPEKNREQG